MGDEELVMCNVCHRFTKVFLREGEEKEVKCQICGHVFSAIMLSEQAAQKLELSGGTHV